MGRRRNVAKRTSAAASWLRASWRSYAPMTVVLVCGLASTFAARTWIKHDLDQEADRILIERTDDIEGQIASRMATYANALVQTLGLLAIKPDLNQSELDSYIKKIELVTRYPGIRGVGLARRIARAALEHHKQAMRAAGFDRYDVKPASDQAEMFPVVLLAPFDAKSRNVIGYDMYSEPVRHAGMQAAIDSGLPQLSGLVHLKADLDVAPTTGLMLYVPVFKSGILPVTPAERRDAVTAILYAPFRTDDLFNGIFGKTPSPLDQSIDFSIYDNNSENPENLVYSRSGALRREFRGNGERFLRHFVVAGRPWSLSLSPSRFFLRSSEGRLPSVVVVFGSLVTGLLFWLLWKNARQARIDRLGRERAEAATSRARLIGACSKLLNGAATSQDDMQQVCALIASSMADVCRIEFCVSGDPPDTVTTVSALRDAADPAYQRLGDFLASPAAAALLHPSGSPQNTSLVQWTDTEELHAAGAGSLIVVPLWLGERSYGILSGLRGQDLELFAPADRICLEEIAHRVAVALERDQLNRATRLAKEQAEAASVAKSMFLANISHEIRTPLGAMLGFAEMLQANVESERERQMFTATILRNGQQLSRLIDDLLDLSKIEAGRLDIELIPTSLSDLLTDIETSLGLRAREKGVALAISISPNVPQAIITDPTRLRQILLNMIGNAIKFTRQGGVGVQVGCEPDGDGSEAIRLSFVVQDSGVGITPERQGALFQPFSQADSSTTRLYGGTGLGLVLSRALAQALGGNVVLAASQPGFGSTFVVTIHAVVCTQISTLSASTQDTAMDALGGPACADERPGAAAHQAAAAPQPLRGLHLLLAEDTPDNQLLIQRLLTAKGATVAVASNGLAALDLVAAQSFDLILMDLQMPVLDGFGATLELRRRGVETPIVALTAHALREEREKSLRAGCNDHLTKPVRSPQLVDAILRLTGAGAARPAAATVPAAADDGGDQTRLRIVGSASRVAQSRSPE